MAADGRRLFIVYNADSGLVAAAADWLHKLVSPSTYACDLCALTHGHLGMRRQWADLVRRMPLPVETLHRDEWRARFPVDRVPLPAILLGGKEGLQPLVDAQALGRLADVAALEALLSDRLSALGLPLR